MAKENVEQTVPSCLRKERIVVRHINKQKGNITDPKHVLYGGMAETATRTFVVPRLSSGRFVNVLTDDEKKFLEDYMGLENNALSIYNKENNYWDDSRPNTNARVTLRKQDNFFDLSNPDEYIKYKILLANKDFIAPSLKELADHPKATYQFVVIEEGEEAKAVKTEMSYTMLCFKEYGKIEDDTETLKLIIEIMDGRPVSSTSKLEFIQSKIYNLIQANPKTFYSIITDKMLPTKVLIRSAVAAHIITKRGDYLYFNNNPLCDDGREPTLNVAAAYLNNPKNQNLKFTIESKLKESKDAE